MTGSAPQHRTIRIRLETYRRLKVLAAQMGVTMVALIEAWVSEVEKERKPWKSDGDEQEDRGT
jgi:predicted DNA-binding protein